MSNKVRFSGFVPLVASILALGLVAACDGDKKEEKREDLEAFANTAINGQEDEKTQAAREADEAERKKAFEARKAEEAAEQKKYDDAVAAYAVLPDKMPKNVDAACKYQVDIYTDWIRRQWAEDAGKQMNYFDNKKVVLGELRGKCVKIDNLEAAACQINILEKAPAGLGEKEKDLLGECVKKFAPEAIDKVAAEEAALKGGGEQAG